MSSLGWEEVSIVLPEGEERVQVLSDTISLIGDAFQLAIQRGLLFEIQTVAGAFPHLAQDARLELELLISVGEIEQGLLFGAEFVTRD